MTTVAVGDLAQSFLLRQLNSRLNADLTRLSTELTTGETTVTPELLRGDYSYLASVERSLKLLKSYESSSTEAQLHASTMQNSLSNAREIITKLSQTLLTAGSSDTPQTRAVAANESYQAFEGLVSTFNTQIGGRTLFAGEATDGPALSSADEMINALMAEVQSSGASTADQVITVVEEWFGSSGGGFEVSGYLGAEGTIENVVIGEGEFVGFEAKADDEAIRDMLKFTAIGVLAGKEPALGNGEYEKQLYAYAATGLLTNDEAIVDVQARIGLTEEKIERIATKNKAAETSMQIARQELVGVDQYEVAVQLQSTETQLQSLYTITARLSSMSLASYI